MPHDPEARRALPGTEKGPGTKDPPVDRVGSLLFWKASVDALDRRFLFFDAKTIYEKSVNWGWIFRIVSCIMDAYK